MRAGPAIAFGLIALALIGGGAMFYLNSFVYTPRDDGRTDVRIGGRMFEVSEYRGVAQASLPLRLRGCFKLADPQAAMQAGPPAPDPAPFSAPFRLDCWDAERLDADLKAGRAKAVIAQVEGSGEFATERIVAIYPDGRAYQWRRLLNPE